VIGLRRGLRSAFYIIECVFVMEYII